jgi:hypothetical protein
MKSSKISLSHHFRRATWQKHKILNIKNPGETSTLNGYAALPMLKEGAFILVLRTMGRWLESLTARS